VFSEQPENAGTSQANPPPIPAEAGGGQAAQDGQLALEGTPQTGQPTPEQVADRVYELFLHDLRVYRERKG
jgi:hypothetical protein